MNNLTFKNACQELVDNVVMNGTEFSDGTLKLAYLNGELVELEEFMEILATNNIRKFLEIQHEVGDNEFEDAKTCIKAFCAVGGVKFSNAIAMKVFRNCQRIMCDMFDSPDKNYIKDIPWFEGSDDEDVEELVSELNSLNQWYVKLCRVLGVEVNEFAIYTEQEEQDEVLDEESKREGVTFVMRGNVMQVNRFFERFENGELNLD